MPNKLYTKEIVCFGLTNVEMKTNRAYHTTFYLFPVLQTAASMQAFCRCCNMAHCTAYAHTERESKDN